MSGEPVCDCQHEFCLRLGCIREHRTMVRNLVYHILRDPGEVDDLVQEVFIKAYQAMDAFRGGSLRAYLGRIARNLCYDVLRRRRSARTGLGQVAPIPDELPDASDGPEDLIIGRETALLVAAILDELNQLDREILLLRHVHQFSYEEIAAVVGLRPGAVRTRISRARQRVLAELERRECLATPHLG
ncbi:RNA polymerase subunit sigma-24 [Alicyclobacillus cellulosilyticus]|uniref:RNA polymerase sigma factor n=1 Tax=Alicyclobacillus cellulosilyticus TaxID=1003997 RepID=A0A917NP43_9BACL|nr:RNA polymerase sigma factor [Alicyclobacillus cellulosilyticus]GGJ12327.1 RNA polymerase subunit sigma-24 [Alicyclobacillus cellulosilyticus]